MALITRVFVCVACDKRFEILQERDEPPPTECPFCSKNEVQGPIPATTAIGARTKSKAVDGMYRQHEEASAYRAELAGDPSIKQTDMKDGFYGGGMKPGDVAAKMPTTGPNVVSDFMQSTGMNPWGLAGSQDAAKALVAQAKSGPGAGGTGGGILAEIHKRNYGPKVPPVAPAAAGGKWG